MATIVERPLSAISNMPSSSQRRRSDSIVEVIDVDLLELAVLDRRQRIGGFSRKIRHDAHDERQFHLLLGAVYLHIILDLDTGSPVACNELLAAALAWHGENG